ncbi:MAG: phosphohydrolase [Lachnospiraceae bacterium]|nr:phosphohydrolase [Lachnospiraceae bacterium]MDY4069883.1 phosphohydrolase [Lachnospiraceae bacterium]
MKKSRRMWKIENLIKAEGNDILHSRNHKSTRKAIQHGNVSVRRHAINVARYSLLINEKLGIKCNKRDLIRGALLHDYFLYDWHDKDHISPLRLHGFFHPGIALRNAEKEYRLSTKEKDIIRKHMWPLTIVPPKCREAWVVSMADKYCSLMETLRIHRQHKGE